MSQQTLTGPAAVMNATDTDARLVRVDKIASSTVNLGLAHDLEITTQCEARAGNRARPQ